MAAQAYASVPPALAPTEVGPYQKDSAGNNISAEEIKRRNRVAGEEKPIEDVMMPHEYLGVGADLLGVADAALPAIEGAISSNAVQRLPGAVARGWDAFRAPAVQAQFFREGFAPAHLGRAYTAEEAAAAGRLAKSIEETPVWDRVKDAMQAFKGYNHEAATKAAAEEVERLSRWQAQKATRATAKLDAPAGEFKAAAPDAGTAAIGGKK